MYHRLKLFTHYSATDSTVVEGTYLKNKSTKLCLVMKNLEEHEFMFQKVNSLNSTYVHHTKNNEIEHLQVDIRLCQQRINSKDDKLSIQELELLVFPKLLEIILNMKPRKSAKEIWMSDVSIMSFDIFQLREDLYGLCFASVFIKEPKEFQTLLD